MCEILFSVIGLRLLWDREGAPPLMESLDSLAASDRASGFYWFYTVVFPCKIFWFLFNRKREPKIHWNFKYVHILLLLWVLINNTHWVNSLLEIFLIFKIWLSYQQYFLEKGKHKILKTTYPAIRLLLPSCQKYMAYPLLFNYKCEMRKNSQYYSALWEWKGKLLF